MSPQRILDLEVAYDVEGILKGGTRLQTVTVKETLPFVVREVDARELHPGISVRDDRNALKTDYPLIDGVLRRKVKPQPYVSKDVPPLSTIKFREILSHGRDSAVARLQAHLDVGVFLGDVLYSPTLGPVLALRGSGLTDRPMIAAAESVGIPAYAVGVEGNVEPFLESLRERRHTVPRDAIAAILSLVEIHVPGCTDPMGFDDRTTVRTAKRVFDTEQTPLRIGKYPNGYLRGWLAYHEEGFDRANASEAMACALRHAASGLGSFGAYTRMDDADRWLVDILKEADLAYAKHAAWEAAPAPPAP